MHYCDIIMVYIMVQITLPTPWNTIICLVHSKEKMRLVIITGGRGGGKGVFLVLATAETVIGMVKQTRYVEFSPSPTMIILMSL